MGTAPWTPLDLPALVAWYAADEPLNTVSGDLVSALHDKSGKGNPASAVGDADSKRAVLVAAAIGDKPAWGYGGAAAQAHFWSHGARLMQTGKAARGLSVTVVAAPVASHSTPPGSIAMLSTGTTETTDRIQIAIGLVAPDAVSGSGRRLDTDDCKTYSSPVALDTGWHILSASNDYLSNTGTLHIDGTLAARESALQTAGHTSTTESRRFWLGTTSTDASNPFQGQTAEVIVHGDALSDTDRQRLEGWLAHKYGKVGDLPADHPYTAVPPSVDLYQGLRPPAVSAWAHITERAPGVRAYARDAEVLRQPASTTKFLSCLVARQWVSDALLDTTVTVTRADIVGGSTMGLQAGDVVSYRDLFHGLMLPSGNDAARCLARTVGSLIRATEGSTGDGVSRFVQAMNEHCAALGTDTGTVFTDANGLNPNSLCSAADMAKIIWAYSEDAFLVDVGATLNRTVSVTGANPRTLMLRTFLARVGAMLGRTPSAPGGTHVRTLALAHTAAPWAALLPEMRTIKTGTRRPVGTDAQKSSGNCLGMLWEDADGTRHVTVVFGAASDPARYEDMRALVDFDRALAAREAGGHLHAPAQTPHAAGEARGQAASPSEQKAL